MKHLDRVRKTIQQIHCEGLRAPPSRQGARTIGFIAFVCLSMVTLVARQLEGSADCLIMNS